MSIDYTAGLRAILWSYLQQKNTFAAEEAIKKLVNSMREPEVSRLMKAETKLAAAERDAARYRWLREHCNEFSVRERIHPDATEWWDTLCGDGLDERLDAAMQSHDGGSEGL